MNVTTITPLPDADVKSAPSPWPAPLRITTLSAAIRAGALARPQARGTFFSLDYGDAPRILGSCALGAAYEAINGGPPDPEFAASLGLSFGAILRALKDAGLPDVLNRVVQHPYEAPLPPQPDHDPRCECAACQMWNYKAAESRLGGVIMSLNDSCGWSREHIAGWLEAQGF